MSKSNAFETDLLNKLFLGTEFPWHSGTNTLYVGLATGDPGEGGNQSTNEASYTGYARVGMARTSGAWTVAAGSVVNAITALFLPCTAGSNTVTHFTVGTSPSGASPLLYSGALNASLAISAGITPQFDAATGISISEE